MKQVSLVLIFLLFSVGFVEAQDHNAGEDAATYNFLNGSYNIIGQYPDSDEAYTGKIVLTYIQGRLDVVRMINHKEIPGKGTIEASTADGIKILRVRFQQDQQMYAATYLIGSDLDNYGRLSGFWYREDGSTKEPGLEALFINHQSVGQ